MGGAPGELYHVPRELIDPIAGLRGRRGAVYSDLTMPGGRGSPRPRRSLPAGRPAAVGQRDYPVEIYSTGLQELRRTIFLAPAWAWHLAPRVLVAAA